MLTNDGREPLTAAGRIRRCGRIAAGGAWTTKRTAATMIDPVGHDLRDRDLQLVLEGERSLLDPRVRRSVELVGRLLHPDFFEFGASGRKWNRRDMVAALVAEGSSDDMPVTTVSDLAAVHLADGVVLVTYLTQDVERRVLRSSLWRRTATGWRLYFHQGTVMSKC